MAKKFVDNLIIIFFLAIIFFTPLYFATFYRDYSVFSLDKTVLFRVLVEVLFLLTLLKTVLNKKIEISFNKWQFLLPSFLIIIYCLATLFSFSPYTSFWGHYWRQNGLFTYFHYYLFYLLILINFNLFTDKILKLFFITIVFSSFFVCFYGLIQYLGFDIFAWSKTNLMQRINSTLGQPNFTGAFLLFSIPISLGSLIIFKNFYLKFFLILSLIFEIIVLLLTYSRSAWIGFMSMAVIFSLILAGINRNKKVIRLIILTILLFLGLVIFSVIRRDILDEVNYEVTIKNKIIHLFDFTSGSGYARLRNYPIFFKIALEKPVLGFGPETIWLWFPKYYSNEFEFDNINNYFDRSHNEILDIMLFSGFIGLAAYFLFLIYFIKSALKIIRSKNNFLKKRLYYIINLSLFIGLVGYLIAIQFGFSVIETNIYFWLYVALIFIISNKLYSREIKIYPLAQLINIKLCYLLLIFVTFTTGLIIWKFSINKILADINFYKAINGIVKKRDFNLINNDILKSFYLDPREDYYRFEYSNSLINTFKDINNCEYKIKSLTIAKSFIEEIPQNRQGINSRINLIQAEALIEQCRNKLDINKIELMVKEALSFMPYMPKARMDIAEMYFKLKQYNETIYFLNEALRLFPNINNSKITLEQRSSIEKDFVYIYSLLGDAYREKQEWQEALNNYLLCQKFLKGEVNFNLRDKIREIHIKNNNVAEALKVDQHSLILSNQSDYYQAKLMEDYYILKDYNQAKKYAEIILKTYPDNELAREIVKKSNIKY